MLSGSPEMTNENDIPHLNPILTKHQKRSAKNVQIEKLLNRLLQEMDDENHDIENLNKIFASLSVKSGIDYNLWKSKQGSVCTEKGTFTNTPISSLENNDTHESFFTIDALQQLKQKTSNRNVLSESERTIHKNKERELLLCLLHREKKLKAHYESVLSSYKDIFTYLINATGARREETYGLYTDSKVSKNSKSNAHTKLTPMKPIESVQIAKTLKNRDEAFKRNAEFLKSLTTNKKMEIEMVKKTLLEESNAFDDILASLDTSIAGPNIEEKQEKEINDTKFKENLNITNS